MPYLTKIIFNDNKTLYIVSETLFCKDLRKIAGTKAKEIIIQKRNESRSQLYKEFEFKETNVNENYADYYKQVNKLRKELK